MYSTAFQTSNSLPGAHPDDLAVVVVRRLEQRSSCRSWGLLKTIVLGVPSFGLLPLLAWPAQFREYVAEESLAMQELAQWAKFRGRQPAAVGPLLAAAEETSSGPLPLILSLVLTALAVGVFAIQFTHVPFKLEHLLAWTYWYDGRASETHARFLHRVWTLSLAIGFAVQWLHVRGHAMTVQRFAERFNPVAEAEGLPPIRFPMKGWVLLRPLWILTAVVLTMNGAWWGILMVLAGMAQKRYTRATGKLLGWELAKRVKDIVTLRHGQDLMMPGMATLAIARRCGNPLCLAPIRPQSRFCTRCGRITTEVPA